MIDTGKKIDVIKGGTTLLVGFVYMAIKPIAFLSALSNALRGKERPGPKNKRMGISNGHNNIPKGF